MVPMKIKVVESTMVKPISATPARSLWISNLDALMPSSYYSRTVQLYRGGDAAVLKAALSRALVDFYPVAGRLKRENERIEIDCNGEGALFVEAEADADMDDLGDVATNAHVSLVPEVDCSKGISTFPLLVVQMTRFKCGGVCLGIATNHIVFDGVSFIHFCNTWSDIARGSAIKVPPFLDRTLLRASDSPDPKFAHIEYQPLPLVQTPSNSKLTFQLFKLTRDQLNALKRTTAADCYSTYEVLAGHIWRCVSEARGLPEGQETKLYIPIDGRSRLRPPLPSGYLGNVIFIAVPVASCGDLIKSRSLGAERIHQALKRMDDEYLRSALDYLELEASRKSNEPRESPFKSPNLWIVSWAKMGFYDADFGWGKPVYAGLEQAPSEEKVIVMPSSVNDGAILCAVSMPEEQINIFEKLFYDIPAECSLAQPQSTLDVLETKQ